MRKNITKEKMLAGKPVFGLMCNCASTLMAEVLGNAGYDFVLVDTQHGETNLDKVEGMMQALSCTNATPIVRVPANISMYIQRVLDLGAYGVVVPLIDNADEARQAVASVRYPPKGKRSWGPTRSTMYSGTGYFDNCEKELLTLVMIETEQGIKNLESILSVEGVDGCFIGPKDLGIALGYSPDLQVLPPEGEKVIENIIRTARNMGKTAGVYVANPYEETKMRIAYGATFMCMVTDTVLVRTASQALLKSVKE